LSGKNASVAKKRKRKKLDKERRKKGKRGVKVVLEGGQEQKRGLAGIFHLASGSAALLASGQHAAKSS
jgi:hypothetical protein